MSQKYATNIISQEISKSVQEVLKQEKLVSSDFFTKTTDKDANTTYIEVDTILVNRICSLISLELSKRLKNINDTKIEMPIGVFSGISAFSELGPSFTVYISSIGDAKVDCETSFKSVGINQINFQAYLNIEASVSIINPMYKRDIEISRKIMLLNTVFNGQVPNTYLDASVD